MKNNKGKIYVPGSGGILSPKDYRDIPLGAALPTELATLPESYESPIANRVPIWHQKKIGSCTGQAGAKKKQQLDISRTGQILPISPRFNYAVNKCIDGWAGEGTYYRNVPKTGQKYGWATEATCPSNNDLTHEAYVYNRKMENIPKEAFYEAERNKTGPYQSVNVQILEDIKRAIYEGDFLYFGMNIGKEWYTDEKGVVTWDGKKILPLRTPHSGIISGHAIVLYGWETLMDRRTLFKGINSWSAEWGDRGKLNFIYEEHRPFLQEAWAMLNLPQEIIDQVQRLPGHDTFSHTYTTQTNLSFGKRNKDVEALQTLLMIEGTFSTTLYEQLLKKKELGYYGNVTVQAVADFQRKYRLASESTILWLTGRWRQQIGPKTFELIKKLSK